MIHTESRKKAGMKSTPKSKPSRARLPSPELFVERNPVPAKKSCITPLRLSRQDGNDCNWEVILILFVCCNLDFNV